MIEIIAALIFVLRQVGQYLTTINGFSAGGNLDPLFLLGILYLIKNINNQKVRKKWFLFIIIFILYGGMQLIITPELDGLKMVINITKILLCLMIMFYVKDAFPKFNYAKFSIIVTTLLGTLTLLALALPASMLWIHDDIINKYDLTRLRLFYIEPSELGFHLLIISLIQLGYLLVAHQKKTKMILGLCLLTNALIMFWTRSLGAIGIGAISIAVMVMIDWYRHRTRQKDLVYVGIIISGLLVFILMIVLRASIIMRLYETINGTDASNFYRITVSFSVSARALVDSYGIGSGFGNMNTQRFALLYWKFGFAKVLANAFLYFLVEGGYFAMVVLFKLIKKLIHTCLSSRSITKWGLLSFLLIYQIVGSYFTNPLIWFVYGIILSDFDENKEKTLQFEALRSWFKVR